MPQTSSTRPASSGLPARRSRVPGSLALLTGLVLAACGSGGGGDVAEVTTTEGAESIESTSEPASSSTSPPRSGDSVRSVVRSADGDFSLEVTSTEQEIWAITNRDDVCSPNEPAVAVFEASLDGVETDEVEAMRAVFVRDDGDEAEPDDDTASTTSTTTTSTTTTIATGVADEPGSSSGTRTVDFAVDEDGVWRAVVGPIRATTRNDRPLAVTVRARTIDGDEAETELDLVVLAPVRCGSGQRPGRNRPTPEPVGLTITTSPASGLIVGPERDDCERRPTTLTVNVEATGAVVAMTASGTLPDGTSVSRAFEGRGGRSFSLRLGPFPSPSTGTTASVRFAVSATDVFGTTIERSLTARLARPEPCEDPEATTTTIVDATDDADFALAFSPDPPLVHSTGTGQCPSGPTTLGLTFTGPSDISAVSVTARTANGETSTVSLSGAGGTWSGSVGPFAGWSGMPTTSNLDIRLSASIDGTTRTLDETARLRRADPCGAGSTTSTTTTTPSSGSTTTTPTGSTTTTTTVPSGSTTTTTTTTSTTTTSTTTTTAPPPPPPSIVNAQANPNPVACGAAVTLGARTSGTVDRVGATIGGSTRNMSGGPTQWTLGATAPTSAGTYTITVTAQGAGQSTSASISLTVTC